jgi:hypothetical protein
MWIKQQRATSYCKGTEMGQRLPCGWPRLPEAAGVDHAASSAPYTVAEAEMAGFRRLRPSTTASRCAAQRSNAAFFSGS